MRFGSKRLHGGGTRDEHPMAVSADATSVTGDSLFPVALLSATEVAALDEPGRSAGCARSDKHMSKLTNAFDDLT